MRFTLTLALCLFFPLIAAAQQEHHHEPMVPPPSAGNISFNMTPERLPDAGQTIRVVSQLTRNGKPLEVDSLKLVHTQKFHLLVVDPTLTDYQHIHPQPTATPGSYLFSFTPKLSGGYRAWADITPVGDTQHYVHADLGEVKPAVINKIESRRAEVGGYIFTLTFDGPINAGGAVMATIFITDNKGQNVGTLEPVMGAFAHLVGFYDDYQTVLHAHPMGEEPKNDDARGGPKLMFHLMPEKSGFVKLFAQVKIGGKEIYAPFGITVLP
jgi:hypothetical protein